MKIIMSYVGVVDVVCAVFLIWGLVRGFIKGFSIQFSRFLNLIVSISVSLCVYEQLAAFVYAKTIIRQPVAESLVLVGVCVFVAFLLKFVFSIFGKLCACEFVYVVERFGGAVVGLLKAALLFSFLSFTVLIWPSQFINKYFEEGSYAAPVATHVIPFMKSYTDYVRDVINARYFAPENGDDMYAVSPAAE